MRGLAFTNPYRKKRSYQQYNKDENLVREVLQHFPAIKDNILKISTVAKAANLPYNTVNQWYHRWEANNAYVPGKLLGKHRRLFTDDQELFIADFIRINYIIPGFIVKRKHLRRQLHELWVSIDPPRRSRVTKVRVSHHFLKDFCKRHKFSFRRMRKKKRSEVSEEEVRQYAEEYMQIIQEYPMNRILNADETPWNLVFNKGDVLAETGTESVAAQMTEDYRKSFTAFCTIVANGDRLPPLFLAQGSTNACHHQFDGMTSDPTKFEIYHSTGGNTNEDVMLFYLELVSKWMNGERCALIIDRYTAHRTENVLNKARSLGIRLVFIPTSATDKYQPLDRRVFGALKSMGADVVDDFVFRTNSAPTKAESADFFVSCWYNLSRRTIASAWDLTENCDSEDDENDEDGNDDPTFTLPEDFNDEEEDGIVPELDEDDVYIAQHAQREERQQPTLTPPRRWLK